MKNESIVYSDIENILSADKNILERAMCLNDFCKNLEGESEKKKYLTCFFKSINSCFGSMYIPNLFDDTENEKRKYIIFTNDEAEIAYFFTKCMNSKREEKCSLILKNMQNSAQNILNRFEPLKDNNLSIKKDVKEILDFLEEKYDLHRKIFKNESTTLSLLNYKDKFSDEENFNKDVITYDISRHYFLFYEKDIRKTLLTKISYLICLTLINKTKSIPEIIKEKLKILGFKEFDNYSLEEQFKILKELVTIGLSYEIPLKDDIPSKFKKEYNSLFLSIYSML
jgi:hypothetical protein